MSENYEQEKSIYIKKLTAQIETISKILNTNTLDLISGEMEKKLRELKQAAERYKQKLEKNEFEIAIVGLEKAGKSTFANAMMGLNILPSDERRCTYTSTKICSGDDTAVVKMFSKGEFDDNFKSRLLEMGIVSEENRNSYSFETLTLSSYKTMFDNLDEKTKKLYRADVNEDVTNILENKTTINKFLGQGILPPFSGEELTSDTFKRFIRNPEYALAVKEISIKSSQLKQEYVIYDVPGFNSPTQIHKQQTREFMRRADAIIMVAFAPKPSFDESIVNFFTKETDYDGVEFGEKMFVFANAADGTANLESSLAEIKRDLKRYGIMKANHFDRIVPGSAAALLIKVGQLEPDRHTQSAVGYADDGIAKIKEILENYNQTERFEILKRRINQKQNEIYDVFKELFKENEVSLSAGYLQSYGKLLNDVRDKGIQIIKDLEAYRAELRHEYNTKKEISQEVKDKVVSEITANNFAVSEEEKTWATNKASDQVTLIDLTSKIDELLREKKRKEIYRKFSEGILELADEHHKKFDTRVLSIFNHNLGISDNSKAATTVEDFLKKQKNIFDGQGYYQSLIDRFSIDLFNILVDIPFADMKRYKRFEDDFENFSSLAMFDDRKSRTNSGNSQPLYYSILFHQTDRYEKNGIINGILDSIKTVLDFIPAPPVVKLVESIVISDKNVDKIANIIKNIGNTLNKSNQTEEQREKQKSMSATKLLNDLKTLAGPNAAFEGNITEKSYEDFFQGKRNKTTENVMSEIEKDIEILHDALNDVVIKAINIEKAFLSLEFRNIDQLLACLDSNIWSDFVNNNLHVINATEFSSLEAEQQRQESKKSILKDIKLLLDQMNNPSTQHNEN